MSNKPVTIPNTFASATSAIPLSQLDADFTALSNVTNDLITYSNYVADTGVADAYIANFSSGITTSTLTAGLSVQFKAGNANTGASTLAVKVNGTTIGTANIVYADGTALAAGAIAAGAIVSVQYNGTAFQMVNDAAGKSGGDVTGPSSSTDTAIALFDGTSGKTIKNSVVTIDGSGNTTGFANVTASGNLTLSGGTANGVLYLNGSKVATSGSSFVFDGTNVGIGTSSPTVISNFTSVTANGTTGVLWDALVGGTIVNRLDCRSGQTALNSYGVLSFGTGSGGSSTERMRLDSSGNLGLGVTPIAWDSSFKAFQLNTTGAVAATSNRTFIGQNWYDAASGGKYIANGYALRYDQVGANGSHAWYISPSGTAGNATSFTQAMTLDASGRLLIGTTSASGSNYLQVNSDASINGLTVGKGGGAVSSNTAVGSGAINASATGTNNSAFGLYSLYNLSSGADNTGIGKQALVNTTTGSNNTAVGSLALLSNTTASNNTAVGYQAGYSNQTGTNNSLLGYQAGYSTTATGIVGVGYKAGYAKNGSDNYASVFVGTEAGVATTSGIDNSFVGGYVARANTTGSYNTALGTAALYSNTTASNNTAVGYQAGYAVTTGIYNNAFGSQALLTNSTSNENNAFGYQALKLATGGSNTAMGSQAGLNLSTGTSNSFFGGGAGYLITTGSKNTVLGGYGGNQGGLDIRTLSNHIVLSDGDGNPRLFINATPLLVCPAVYSNTTGAGANIYVDASGGFYRSTSALKYKQDIRDLESIDINKFRPVRYKSKCENDDQTKDHFGVIADEVHDAGITELVTYGADGEIEGFQYERLTVVLLKTIQDLQARIETLENK